MNPEHQENLEATLMVKQGGLKRPLTEDKSNLRSAIAHLLYPKYTEINTMYPILTSAKLSRLALCSTRLP